MKKLFIGLMALTSVSAFAEVTLLHDTCNLFAPNYDAQKIRDLGFNPMQPDQLVNTTHYLILGGFAVAADPRGKNSRALANLVDHSTEGNKEILALSTWCKSKVAPFGTNVGNCFDHIDQLVFESLPRCKLNR